MKVSASDLARRSSRRLEGATPRAFDLCGGRAVYDAGTRAAQIGTGAAEGGGER